jgi:hypothetical protein
VLGHLVQVVINDRALIVEIDLPRPLLVGNLGAEVLVALRTVSTLSKVNGVLQLGEVHGAVEAVHTHGIIMVILIVVVVVLLSLLMWPIWHLVGAIICGFSRLGGSTDVGQLLIDHSHFTHVLLETFFLVLVNISRLQLANVILVSLDVSLGLLGILICPEELLHVIAVVLHSEILEEGDQHIHQRPQVRGISWIDEFFSPEVEHDDDRVEDDSETLRNNHESISDPHGDDGPNKEVESIHGAEWQVDATHISCLDDLRHEHQRDTTAHDIGYGPEHTAHCCRHHVKVKHLRNQDHKEELANQR